MKILIFLIFSSMSISTFADIKSRYEELDVIKEYNLYDSTKRGRRNLYESTRNYYGITEIGIQRTECNGSCPVYSFIVTNKGEVTYEGYKYVDKLGVHQGKLRTAHFSLVAEFIDAGNIVSMQNTYTLIGADSSTVYTLVEKDGKEKIIMHYGNTGPIELWAIEELIDSLLDHVEWVK